MNAILPLSHGNVCLTHLDTEAVRNTYPGITRVKPTGYFGEPVANVLERLGLNADNQHETEREQAKHYSGVCRAYQHYWREPLGRMHCYEPAYPELRQSAAHDIAHAIMPAVTPAMPEGKGVLLGFEIPAIELYRRSATAPITQGRLIITDGAKANNDALFYQVEHDALLRAGCHPAAVARRETPSGLTWISAQEADTWAVDKTAITQIASTAKGGRQRVSAQYQAHSWELMSVSIGAAHLGRLIGEMTAWRATPSLRGLVIAGNVQTILTERFKPLLALLPHNASIMWGIGRAYFRTDASALDALIQAAHKAQLLPLVAIEPEHARRFINNAQDESVFNLLFGLSLAGDTQALLRANQSALEKGGIL